MATIINKTIKTSGGDYANMAALANADADLVAANQAWVVTCDNFQDTTIADFNGWVTSAECYLRIVAADSHNSGGAISTSAYRLIVNSTGPAIRMSGTAVGASGLIIFDGIQISNTNAGTGAHAISDITSGSAFTVRCVNCILNDAYYNWHLSGKCEMEIINCFGLGSARSVYCDDANGIMRIYHSTLYGSQYGVAINNAGAVATVKNSYLGGGTSSIQVWAGTLNQTRVATSDADSADVDLDNIAYSTANFTSVTGGSEDLHLTETSALIGQGTDLSGESAPFNISTDIDGESRTIATPDIGADEYVFVANSIPHSPSLGLFVIGSGSTTVPNVHLGMVVQGGPHDVPPAYLGLTIFSTALAHANRQGYLGLTIDSEGNYVPTAPLGLYIDALPLTTVPNAPLGMIASGLYETTDAHVGLFMWGHPARDYRAETQGRLLVKANSEDAVGQDMEIDAVTIFKALGTSDFNAKWVAYRQDIAEFYAKLKITRYINPPTIQITEVNYKLADGESVASGSPIPNFYNGARRMEVKVDGWLGDSDEWSHAQIDFGEPWRGNAATYHSSISGFTSDPIWTADHVYNTSGVYIITARAVDNFGSVASDVRILNLASGLTVGTDYPAISITATPRLGDVPPALQVSFTTTSSGSLSISTPTDDRIFWNFGNREISKRKNPITYYQSPGLYTPVCRLRYRHNSGNYIWIADTLRIGYNY